MVGVVLITTALLRAGWIADLLSIPVITGFMAGISIHIIVGQLPALLGIQGSGGRLLHAIPATAAVTCRTQSLGRWQSACSCWSRSRRRSDWRRAGPAALLALAAGRPSPRAAFASGRARRGDADAAAGQLCRDRRAGRAARRCRGPGAAGADRFALVCMMQTAAVLRTFPSHPDGPHHVARDFGGIGAGCILSGAARRLRRQFQSAAHRRRGLGRRTLPGGVAGRSRARGRGAVRRQRAAGRDAARRAGRHPDRGRAADFPVEGDHRASHATAAPKSGWWPPASC